MPDAPTADRPDDPSAAIDARPDVPEPQTPRTPRTPRRRRTIRVIRIAGVSLLGVIAAAVVGILIWANQTFAPAQAGWNAALADDRITVRDDGDIVVLTPSDEAQPTIDDQGLVFLAGAKVDPQAYASTFRDLTAEGVTVVIVRPVLNLAIIEWRDLAQFTAEAPDVSTWAVGGHSQGGVRACSYAEDESVSALVLLGSYCALGDLSGRDDLSAISVTGSRDGLLRAEDAAEARALMPADSTFVELDGVNHAQFGDYGVQPGDLEARVSDDEARSAISAALIAFFERA